MESTPVDFDGIALLQDDPTLLSTGAAIESTDQRTASSGHTGLELTVASVKDAMGACVPSGGPADLGHLLSQSFGWPTSGQISFTEVLHAVQAAL